MSVLRDAFRLPPDLVQMVRYERQRVKYGEDVQRRQPLHSGESEEGSSGSGRLRGMPKVWYMALKCQRRIQKVDIFVD
jgi:hypothetical protein